MTTHNDNMGIPENPYADEAKQRWGDSDAYKESQRRVAKMTKDDWARVQQAGDALMKEIVAAAEAGKDPKSDDVQTLIARHYDGLRTFYEPNLEMYRGLADMYVADARFAAFYDNYRPGLALYMRDAMHAFCEAQSQQ